MDMTISFVLNGINETLAVSPGDRLLDVLRDRLGLTSPKYGCGRGECGACTSLMDGMAVRSCLKLAVEADGADIVTLEGIANHLHVDFAVPAHVADRIAVGDWVNMTA